MVHSRGLDLVESILNFEDTIMVENPTYLAAIQSSGLL